MAQQQLPNQVMINSCFIHNKKVLRSDICVCVMYIYCVNSITRRSRPSEGWSKCSYFIRYADQNSCSGDGVSEKLHVIE